jgi:hypothetical protein
MSKGRISVVLFACVLIALTACTPAPIKPTTPQPTPHPTLTIAPRVLLGCAQGNSADWPIPPEFLITDTVGTSFVANPVSKLPRAHDVGVAAPSSVWRFNKSPLNLNAATTVTITITVPDDGRQYLLWVPSTAWGGEATHAVQQQWITHQVVATGCVQGGVFFFGGILAIDPERCFTLSVESADGSRKTLEVRADGGHCPAGRRL